MKYISVILLMLLSSAHTAKILGYFPTPSISHQKVFQPIWKELSLRGHEVTVITADPLKTTELKNLTEIDIHFTYTMWKYVDITNLRRDVLSAFEMEYKSQTLMATPVLLSLNNEEVKKALKKPKDYFDLLLIESFNPILYGLQHKFSAPLIAVSSFSDLNYLNNLFGYSVHPALYGDLLNYLYGTLTFCEKIENLYVLIGSYLMNKWIIYPEADQKAREHFGNDMPYIEDMVKKTSLLLENINPVLSHGRPLPPNVIHFSNVISSNPEPVTIDLQKILDNAKDGVVYFSLGTNVRFDHVQGNIKESILQALGELPYTVLCKWESEDFPGKPKNVILRKWFPQQSILAHPNVKLFVTQGGLQSSEEAIINGIPLVVIPFLGDQPMNAKILTTHGMAETIAPKDLNKDILRDTILKVLKDEKYRLKAQELRSIFLDQPQSGIDKIIWWCEYVIRHKGAKHLRSPSADISLYEYFMLDIFAVILIVLFVIYKIISIILRRLIRLIKGDNSVSKSIEKKKKQ